MPHHTFRPGEMVAVIKDGTSNCFRFKIGETYLVTSVRNQYRIVLELSRHPDMQLWYSMDVDASFFAPISPSPTPMTTVVEFLKDKARSSEDRALIRADLMTADGDLTEQGRAVLLKLLFAEKKGDMAKIAKEVIEASEKRKK